jgi:hypothetical protein
MAKKKLHFWRYALICFFVLVIILPYPSLISTNLHEAAHMKAYEKYGICAEYKYKPNMISAIYALYLRGNQSIMGLVGPCDEKARAGYDALPNEAKEEIDLAGIKSDLRMLDIAQAFFMALVLVSILVLFLVKDDELKKILLLNILIIMIVLILWSIDLIGSTRLNLFIGDLQSLLAFWK